MSIIKHINYREHLPVLLGPRAMNLINDLKISRASKRPNNTRFTKMPDPEELAARNGRFTAPDEDDPSIRQEFLVAGYRYGHAQIPEQLLATDSTLSRNQRLDLKEMVKT